MRKIQYILCVGLLMLLSCSCSKSFTIKGNLLGLNEGAVKMIVFTPEGAREVVTHAEANRFEMKGFSDEPTLVILYDSQMRPLGRFVLGNGDELQVRGEAGNLYGIQVKGAEINERWVDFITQHKKEYTNFNHDALDAVIEKYVGEHPDDVLSTLLVMVDYNQLNNSEKTSALLKKITDDAKPEWLTRSYRMLLESKKQLSNEKRLFDLSMMGQGGDTKQVSPREARATVLYFWTYNTGHRNEIKALKKMETSYGKRLQIADLYMEPDTAAWRSHLEVDSTKWTHLWVPNGPTNQAIKYLNITSVPFYVVADSLGNIKYKGNNVVPMEQEVKKILNK